MIKNLGLFWRQWRPGKSTKQVLGPAQLPSVRWSQWNLTHYTLSEPALLIRQMPSQRHMAWVLRLASSSANVPPRTTSVPVSNSPKRGIKGPNAVAESLSGGQTSEKQRTCGCLTHFALGACSGWEPINKPSGQRTGIVPVTMASPWKGSLSESHSWAEWGRRGMWSETAGGAGDRLQRVSLVAGHFVGWSPL